MSDAVTLDVLGPLRVRTSAGDVRVPPGRPARALTWLVLHVDDAVSFETLAAVLWTRPPDNAVARARAVVRGLVDLVGADTLDASGPARLTVPRAAVDAVRFETGVREAQRLRAAGDASRARVLLEQTMSLWRGRPYADLDHTVEVAGVAARLSALRLDAVEALAAVRLADAACADVDYTLVADLRSWVVLHPERTALRRLLALALYRTGRQVDALQTLRAARAELGDGDGSVERLQRAVLEHDPALARGGPSVHTA